MLKKRARGVCVLSMALLIAVTSLTSCQTKQESGTLIGGATGALIGSMFGGRLLGMAIGGVVGAVAGNAIGSNLDEKDKEKMTASTHRALENSKIGQTSAWSNSKSGNSGTVVPTRAYRSVGGEYCREYTHTVNIGGKVQEAYGTACRKPNGMWHIIS
jgi:surface antigen